MSEPAFSLLHTKLYRPPAGDGTVARPRLLARLDDSLNRPLILITAPAGYGKTTLVTSWLDAAGHPHAWLSLDENDSDLATFLTYLIATVRSAFPAMGEAADAALRAPTQPSPAVLSDLFLHDLAGLPDNLFVVLDDYHAVTSREVRAFMERLISYLPARLHLVLLARADPLLSLGRLRGRGQLLELRGADLRFTLDEAGALLQRIVGGDLPGELTVLLAERTEGWPAGLQLAAISLRDSANPQAFAMRFAQSNSRMLMDYLIAEVLDQLPETQRARLLRTSILDRFCAPLCEAVSDDATVEETGAEFIDSLWRANLFVTALDEEGVWHRYHHMFRDLLRHQLRQTAPADAIAGLHRKASAWFEGAGLVEEAIAHAIAGGDNRKAAQLLESNLHQALNREDWRRIERWIAMMPESMLLDPIVLIAQAFLQHFRHRIAAIFPMVEAAERGLEADASSYTSAQKQRLLGAINTLRTTPFVTGGIERALGASRAALQQLGPEMVFERGLAEFGLLYGMHLSGQSSAAVERARRELEQQRDRPDARTLRLLLLLCGVYYDEANVPMAEVTATTYRAVALQERRGLSLAWANFVLGWAHYQHNELDAAAHHFRQVVEAPYEAHGRAAIDSFIGLALTLHAQGKTGDAREVVSGLRALLLDRGMVSMMPIAETLALRIHDEPECAEAPDGLAANLEDQITADFWEVPGLTVVRTALRSGAPEGLAGAAELLRVCRESAEDRNLARRCIEIAVLEAQLHAARSDGAAALEAVRRAVTLGESGGGLRFFLDDGPDLPPYLQQLLDQDVAPVYVRAILTAYAEKEAGLGSVAALLLPGVRRPVRAADPAVLLTNREMDVLLLLEKRLTNKEIAAHLMISPRTVQKHTVNIYEKLHAGNRREAVARARGLGLLLSSS